MVVGESTFVNPPGIGRKSEAEAWEARETSEEAVCGKLD